MTSIFPPQVGKEKTEWFVVKEASTVNCQISQSDCATCNSVDEVQTRLPFPLVGLKGVWVKGVWVKGVWVKGVWLKGVWVKGVWLKGVWVQD